MDGEAYEGNEPIMDGEEPAGLSVGLGIGLSVGTAIGLELGNGDGAIVGGQFDAALVLIKVPSLLKH